MRARRPRFDAASVGVRPAARRAALQDRCGRAAGADEAAGAVERARRELEREEAVPLDRAGQPQAAGLLAPRSRSGRNRAHRRRAGRRRGRAGVPRQRRGASARRRCRGCGSQARPPAARAAEPARRRRGDVPEPHGADDASPSARDEATALGRQAAFAQALRASCDNGSRRRPRRAALRARRRRPDVRDAV